MIDYRTDHNIEYDCIYHDDTLIDVDHQIGIHTAIKNFNGISSKILREGFSWLKSRIPELWTNFIPLQLLMELVLKL